MEDLDAFAGNIALKHADDNIKETRPLLLVTASIDKIRLKTKTLPISDDYIIGGQVIWVGKSSMDILVEIHSKKEVLKYSSDSKPHLINNLDSINDLGKHSRILSSYFTYVAKDRTTNRPVQLNKLLPITSDEIQLFQIRNEMSQARRTSEPKLFHDPSKSSLTSIVERGCAVEDSKYNFNYL